MNINRCVSFGKAIVVSAFPGMGKSYIAKHSDGKKVLDSDSSQFSWLLDSNGNKILDDNGKPIREPNFPNNYMQHIKDNIDSADIIFVSSHENVRQALNDENIDHCIVYPREDMKEEMIHRYITRGNDKNFVEKIKENWDKFLEGIKNDKCPNKIEIQPGQYLSDVMPEIKQKMDLSV